jgi:hypothetical protein
MPASIVGGSLLARRDAIARVYTAAFSMGPTQRGDTSAGLYDRVWRVHTTPGEVHLARANDANSAFEAATLLFGFAGAEIDDLDLGFDTNGAAVVAAQRPTGPDGEAEFWLYYFDVRVPGSVFQRIDYGRTPRLILDDPEGTDADLLIFYLNDRNQRVEIRVQRENYEVAHLLPVDKWYDLETGLSAIQSDTLTMHLEDVAKATDYRLHVYASDRNAVSGRYRFLVAESAPYPYRMTESLSSVHEARDLSFLEVVKQLTFEEVLSAEHEIESLALLELSMNYVPEAETLSSLGRIQSLVLVVVLVNYSAEAEILSATHRVQSLTLVVVSINLGPDPETLSHSHRTQSLTLSAA